MKAFADWLAAKLGTRQWIVAPRLTERLRRKGYTLALSRERFTALMDKYKAEVFKP